MDIWLTYRRKCMYCQKKFITRCDYVSICEFCRKKVIETAMNAACHDNKEIKIEDSRLYNS